MQKKLNSKVVKDIREAANKGLALGSASFIARVEKLTGSKLRKGKPGRPIAAK